jgi:hypothetical protein
MLLFAEFIEQFLQRSQIVLGQVQILCVRSFKLGQVKGINNANSYLCIRPSAN